MSGNLSGKVQSHSRVLNNIKVTIGNIDQRIGFIESKLESIDERTKSGNDVRKWIGLVVVVKILFDGFGSVDWNGVKQLLQLIGGV